MNKYLDYLNHWRLFLYISGLTQLKKLSQLTPLTNLTKLNIEKRYRINIGRPTKINILLVGCDGSGSFAAHILAQFAVWATGEGLDVRLTFIDPDHVEVRRTAA